MLLYEPIEDASGQMVDASRILRLAHLVQPHFEAHIEFGSDVPNHHLEVTGAALMTPREAERTEANPGLHNAFPKYQSAASTPAIRSSDVELVGAATVESFTRKFPLAS